MKQSVILTGMVLRVMPIGEYDKRITLLTRERGKIAAFIKGARRPNSPLLAAGAPFAFGEFELYEGRSSYNVKRAEIHRYFRELTTDLEHTYYGFYFLELADYFTQENNDEQDVLRLLYQSLRALEKETLANRLVRRIYELKLLVINGIYPNVFSCQQCGKEEELTGFSVTRAGTLCIDCMHEGTSYPLSGSTLYTMQYIITSELKKLYTFTVSDEVLRELEQILDAYMEKYVAHTFQTAQFLVC